MKKILLIADFNDTGGTGEYLKRLIEYLHPRYGVHMVLHQRQTESGLLEFIKISGISFSFDYCLFPMVEHFFTRVFRRLHLLLFFELIRDTIVRLRLEYRYKPDGIVISQGGGCRYFPFLLSKRPVFLIMHSLFLHSILNEKLAKYYLKFYTNISENKKICSVSRIASDLFKNNIHFNSISKRLISVPTYGNRPRNNIKKPREKITILTIGHVINYKNPFVWLEVAKQITEKYHDSVDFVWAGNGEQYKKMKELTSGNNLIKFLGFRKDTQGLYNAADIYFQPSCWESQGIAVVEAMANKIPCVVSCAGGLVDSIEHGKEGFVCGIDTIDEYVNAITILINDNRLRMALGENAKKKFESLFSKEKWEMKMNEIMNEILPEIQERRINS